MKDLNLQNINILSDVKPIDIVYNKIIIGIMIETEQKIIQIGSSEGVTLSKKDLTKLGAKRGDIVKLRVELSKASYDKHKKLMNEYEAFVSVYGQTLKNLSEK